MPKESSIQSSVLKYLNSIPGCIAENVSGNSSQSGRADINGCINGCSFRIELKSLDHGNRPTKKQLYNLLQWQKAGAVVMVAYSLEDVKTCFRTDGSVLKHFLHEYGSKLFSFIVTSKTDEKIDTLLRGAE